MRAKLLAAVVAVAVVVPAAVAGTAVVTPVWLGPDELTPEVQNSVGDQRVAVDQNGDAMAVWGGPGGVEASLRRSGGTWEQPVRLADCGGSARVAFDIAGTATVAWLQCDELGSRVMTAFFRLHTGWSQPVALSTPGRQAGFLRLAVAQSGMAVASWGETDGHFWVVEAATREPNDIAAWSPATQLSSVGADAYDSSPAVDETGDAVVGWTRGDPSGSIVWTAFKPSGEGWQPAVNLSPPGSVGTDIVVAIRTGGTAVAVWDQNAQGRWAMRSSVTGAWSASEPFPAPARNLHASGSGDILADWVGNGIMAAEMQAGTTTWSPPFQVSSQQSWPNSYAVLFDGARGLVALWGMQDQDGNGSFAVSRRPLGSTAWGTPVTIAVPGKYDDVFNADYDVDGLGDAVAVYETAFGSSVATALLDSAAPYLAWLSYRRTGRVGRKLTFAAGPVDFTRVSFRWQFGDGRAATGQSVTHAYRKAGRFAVTLVATDAAGHSALVTRTSVSITRR